jgi:hypothetical protein
MARKEWEQIAADTARLYAEEVVSWLARLGVRTVADEQVQPGSSWSGVPFVVESTVAIPIAGPGPIRWVLCGYQMNPADNEFTGQQAVLHLLVPDERITPQLRRFSLSSRVTGKGENGDVTWKGPDARLGLKERLREIDAIRDAIVATRIIVRITASRDRGCWVITAPHSYWKSGDVGSRPGISPQIWDAYEAIGVALLNAPMARAG